MTQIDLAAVDATAQAEMVRSRALSARQLVRSTLQRIDEIEPTVNAFRVVTRERALADADRIDSLTDAELADLPLAGVPVAIKDDTDVAGQSTMWGSVVDRGASETDAEVVRRLRQAGATIIGKTNVPELTLWPWTASERWGVTRNPWNVERTAGGSSGGSAAAVCTGMAAMALGSDGGGSVRYPAGLTGLVGVKPQRGRVPLGPEHASGWHGLVVLGPLTRSVRDAALFLDAVSAPAPSTTFRDAIIDPPSPLRIAVSTNPPPGTRVSLSPAARTAVERAAEVLAGLGHEIVEVDIDYGLSALWSATVRLVKGARDDVASLSRPDQLEARTRAVARLGELLPARSLGRALERERRIAASINGVFDGADVVLTPLCESAAPLVDDCPTRGALRSLRAANTSAWLVPWNLIGQPAVAVPMGIDDDLPTAVHLAGRVDDEVTLLALAAQIERARPFPRWSRPSSCQREAVEPAVELRRLDRAELARVGEIDRTERIDVLYDQHGSELVARHGDWSASAWDPHSVAARVHALEQYVDKGGIALGAFAADWLVGIGVVVTHLRPGIAQLAFLHVSAPFRATGIGRRLSEQLDQIARTAGDSAIVVSATPTGNTVRFYLARGYHPTAEPLPDLLALEPEDIHMHKPL